MKKQILFLATALVLILSACKKETTYVNQTVVDNYIYAVDGEELYQSNIEKDKEKSPEQYLSILYTNLFKTTIGQNDLLQLAEVRRAIGDKQMADELVLNGFINNIDLELPTDSEMRADIDQFIENTYIRFFLRMPTPYEIYELKDAIESDVGLSPELVYQGFALSNEYKFY